MTWVLRLTGGNWTPMVSGGNCPSGTTSLVGSSGQIWSFTFDQGSKGAFDQFLATIATRGPWQVTP